MSGFRWYMGVAAAVIAIVWTLTFARIVRRLFSALYGSVFIEPASGRSSGADRLQALFRIWLVYMITIVMFTFTSGSLAFVGSMLNLATPDFNLQTARDVLLANATIIHQTLIAGLFVGTVVVVIARWLTISYSDFLVRYLVMQVLAPITIVFVTAPLVFSGPGLQYYEALSDFALRTLFPELPSMILVTASTAALGTELAIWLQFKYHPGCGRGAFPLLSTVLAGLVEGEYTISHDNVTELYEAAIQEAIETGDPEPDDRSSAWRWLSSSGTVAIAECFRTEVRASIAENRYGIRAALICAYDQAARKRASELSRDSRLSERTAKRLLAALEEVENERALPAGAASFLQFLEDTLERDAQDVLHRRLRVITTEEAAVRLERVVCAKFHRAETIGNRRFLTLDGDSLVLTCPVPRGVKEVEKHSSNMGMLIENSPYLVHGHVDAFDAWWQDPDPEDENGFRPALSAVLTGNLGLHAGEQALILVDSLKPYLVWAAHIAREVASDLAGTNHSPRLVCYPPSGGTAIEPPFRVWEAAFGPTVYHALRQNGLLERLLRKENLEKGELDHIQRLVSEHSAEVVDVVLALSWFSVSHSHFRQLLCGTRDDPRKTRFASMPRLLPPVLRRCSVQHLEEISERTNAVARKLSQATGARLTAPNGTDLEFVLEGRTAVASSGILTEPGRFGNIPGGEAYIAPIEESTEGRLAFEYVPERRLRTPMHLRIRGGKARRPRGERQYKAFLRRKFREDEKNRQVAELGVGTNHRVTDLTTIRESEKMLGTVHVALGDNYRFGGTNSTEFHEDFVITEPTLVLTMEDGSQYELIRAGVLSEELM